MEFIGAACVGVVGVVAAGVIVYVNRQRRRAIAAMEKKRRDRNQREAEELLRETHPETGRPIGNYGPGSRRDHVQKRQPQPAGRKYNPDWAQERMAADAAARKRREEDHEEELRRRRIDNDTQTQTVGLMSPSQPYYRQDDTPSRCDDTPSRSHHSSSRCSSSSWGGSSDSGSSSSYDSGSSSCSSSSGCD